MRYEQLPSEIRRLNRELKRHFGMDDDDMAPMWRVSWSDDQYEKRLSKYTTSGIELLYPIVQELPKYPWVAGRWMLENRVLVPEVSRIELGGITKSYECMYAFPTRDKQPIQPSFAACKFLADAVLAAKGKESLGPKYAHPLAGMKSEEIKHAKKVEIDAIMEELFGDESFLMGRTITGEASAMPQQYGNIEKG